MSGATDALWFLVYWFVAYAGFLVLTGAAFWALHWLGSRAQRAAKDDR